MTKVVCKNCGSANLHHYKEFQHFEKRKISNGKIQRKPFAAQGVGYALPDHIDCEDCGETHYYRTDDKGKIIEFEREGLA